ncbi:hypothetical protein, partial [Klebsiella pneumoniae]|uniref:hypothetical protein n=1 Tax=Klebsiella pneumoniae TaxID=573 RepID=UPI0020730156
KRAYCLKTQPATGETYPKSDLFNKATRLLNYSRFSMVRYGKRYGSVVQQDDLSQHYIKECWRLFSISMRMHTPFP